MAHDLIWFQIIMLDSRAISTGGKYRELFFLINVYFLIIHKQGTKIIHTEMVYILPMLKIYWIFSISFPSIFHIGLIILVTKSNLFPYSTIFIDGLPTAGY